MVEKEERKREKGKRKREKGKGKRENSVTPSFQERSELKDDGGFSETQDLKSANGGESNVDSRTNSDPSETNPNEVRIGKGKTE